MERTAAVGQTPSRPGKASYVLVDRERLVGDERMSGLLDYLDAQGGVAVIGDDSEVARLVDQLVSEYSPREGQHDRRMAVAQHARMLMTADITRTITIGELAESCGVSPTKLKECFKECFGQPIYSWYRAYRIHRACDILRDHPDQSIAQAAAEVGYANPSKFSKAFSDTMGMTPYAWRASGIS